jgi:hypothetical protein
MKTTTQPIPPRSFFSRVGVPILAVAGTFILCEIIYYNVWRLDPSLFRSFMSYLSAGLSFFLIILGGFVIYPLLYFRGARPAERVIASLVILVIWTGEFIVSLIPIYSLAEVLYFFLINMMVLSIGLQFGAMGISEILCRLYVKHRRGIEVKVLSFWPVAGIVFFVSISYAAFLWGMGRPWFFNYFKIYQALFT